jgi:hypothetical protein
MHFTATWFRSEEILSREKCENFFAARDIARARLATQKVRAGATHAEVRSDDGVLFFDSRADMVRPPSRPALGARLVKRWAPRALEAV